MSAASKRSQRQTSMELFSSTPSLASPSGATPSALPVGPTVKRSGPAPVPVSPSATQAAAKASPTSATSGPTGSSSSPSAALQSFLESRLRARTALLGSTLYNLTWKERVTPSQRSISALRASARRTSDSASTSQPSDPTLKVGWPTTTSKDSAASGARDYPPTATHHAGTTLTDAANLAGWPSPMRADGAGGRSSEGATATGKTPDGRKVSVSLNHVAKMAGWPTTGAKDGEKSVRTQSGAEAEAERKGWTNDLCTAAFAALPVAGWGTPTANTPGGTPDQAVQRKEGLNCGAVPTCLAHQVQLVGWSTPSARYRKDTPGMAETGVNPDGSTRSRLDQLPRQAQLTDTGPTLNGSPVETAKRGQLNPAFSRWLMGLPSAWDSTAPWKSKRVRRSSKPTATASSRRKRSNSSKP